ncbi:MAG: glycolate oxidase binding subunit [Actinomycetota bacterium]|jgi:glycolate oxidase FAD binding subunit|nr:glycolate oxidase binding subunit [Actinomycetota bacterium]
MDATHSLERFAADIGPDEPVTPVGGRTQWTTGGLPSPPGRAVYAPGGVVSHQPEEMIVRVRAGTPVADLDAALAGRGQMVALDPYDPEVATVGGVLAVGRSGHRALRYGPVRDSVLEVRYVSDGGKLVKAGAPVVKNVSGFDLCRLLVGSLGTLGILAEVVLRCRPVPQSSQWLRTTLPASEVRRRLFRPSCVVQDDRGAWVLLEGHPADMADERASLGRGAVEVEAPTPEVLHRLLDRRHRPVPRDATLHRRVKDLFDPRGRLNPGRDPLAA